MRVPALLLASFISILGASSFANACELGVYTYDSIAGKGGLGQQIFPEFEKLTGCKIRVLASGDALQALGRVEIDFKRDKLAGDILLGVDNLMWPRVEAIADVSESVDPRMSQRLEPEVRNALSRFPGLIPYDFGALAFIADENQFAHSAASGVPPRSLADLTQSKWHRSLILEDPRTSTPGLQFVLYTEKILGSSFTDFWKKLRGQWLAMPAGWDAAYSLFLKGKAPLAWSYVTSEAYHREHGSTRYKAVLFREGQPLQLEGAVMIHGTRQPELARKFMRFLLSDYVQDRVAGTNWMWPVRKDMTVPPGFLKIPKVKKSFVLSGENAAKVLNEWSKAVHE